MVHGTEVQAFPIDSKPWLYFLCWQYCFPGGFWFFASPLSRKWYFGVGSDSTHHATRGQGEGMNTAHIAR